MLKKLTPDPKTLADFRQDTLKALKAVCCEITLLSKRLGLLGGEVVAIDGSKFKAVTNRKRTFTQQKLERAIREIDQKSEGYLQEGAQAAKEEPELKTPTAAELQEKLPQLHDRQQKHQGVEQKRKQSGGTQVSLTDPDSRSMLVGQATDICDNVQTVVEAKHEVIVAPEVTNALTAQGQLAERALGAKATLGVEQLEVGADMGYFAGDEGKKCTAAGITPSIAKPTTSANKKRGLDTKEEFTYDQAKDGYRCPQGAEFPLPLRHCGAWAPQQVLGDAYLPGLSSEAAVYNEQGRETEYALGRGRLTRREGATSQGQSADDEAQTTTL